MLKNICDAKFQSPFILFVGHNTDQSAGCTYVCDPLHPLVDDADRYSSSLFLALLKSYISASDRITHVLCWEKTTLTFLRQITPQDSSKLVIHDCLSDFHGWINAEHQETGFISVIKRSLSGDFNEVNVIVDSLSNSLFTIGFGTCVKELQQMINSKIDGKLKVHQLLCFVHADVIPCGPSSLSYLKHLASTVVELKNQVAHITHCKPGGHVERKDEKFAILSEGEINIQPFMSCAQIELMNSEDKQAILPQDIASFRVSLSEKEKEDRDKLILPYMRAKKLEEGGGKVFYQPDAVDDWDDEDPDDDLDV